MKPELHDRLRGAPLPHAEDARRRAWEVVRAAAPATARRRRRRRLAATLVVAAGVAVALSPPGAAVGEWVRERVDPPERMPRPAATPAVRLPATGQLLVRDGRGVAVVGRDGDRTRLGDHDGATWSPNGRFVAAWRGPTLTALTPRGEPRWTLTAPAPVAAARWSPDPGYRIAYVTTAGELRIVAGDGTGDRLLANGLDRRPGAAPAWRPGAGHVVAFLQGARVEVRDADTGARVARAPVPAGTRSLTWSPDGRRIAATAPGGLRVVDTTSGRVRRIAPPRGARFTASAYAPTQPRLARVTRARGRAVVTVGRRAVFATRGRIAGVAWSPDGRWLMLDTPDAGQLVAVRVVGPPRVLSFPGGALLGWSGHGLPHSE